MSAVDPAEPEARGGRAWWLLIVVTFAAQLGFIFWLGDKQPITPRTPTAGPELHLAQGSEVNSELLALKDPTLFALPRREGFAGMTWLRIRPQQEQPFEWEESPRWLALRPEALGKEFPGLVETNAPGRWHWPAMPPPEMRVPEEEAPNAFPTQSSLRVEGEDVSLTANPALPSWPAIQISATETALLTNSIVQVMINGAGKPVSATLLVRSGAKEADDYALNFARDARFNSISVEAETSNPAAGLRWCRLIFDWHTTLEQTKPSPSPAP